MRENNGSWVAVLFLGATAVSHVHPQHPQEQAAAVQEAFDTEQNMALDQCVGLIRDYALKGSASLCATWLVAWNEVQEKFSEADTAKEGVTLAENAHAFCAALQAHHNLPGSRRLRGLEISRA